MTDQNGFVLLAVILILSVGVAAAFALTPSMDREDIVEAQRFRYEEARAAAEGVAAAAIHREGDVELMTIGRATATADFTPDGDEAVVTATGVVSGLRDGEVRVVVTVRARRAPDGTFTVVAWD